MRLLFIYLGLRVIRAFDRSNFNLAVRFRFLFAIIEGMKKHKTYQHIQYILIICILLYAVQLAFHVFTSTPQRNEQIAILGFHNVVHDDEKERYYKTNMWVESLSSFEEKINYLYEEGYHTITLDELYDWKRGALEIDEKSIVLTFDDGYYASSNIIPEILEKYGFTASTFVVGSAVEGEHTWDASRLQYVNKQDMLDTSIMKYYSHTYAMHGKTEGAFTFDVADEAQMQMDIEMQKEFVDITYFAYPFGYYNDTIIQVLKQNDVKLAFGYNENKKATRAGDHYTIPRFAVTAYTNMEVFKAMLESNT